MKNLNEANSNSSYFDLDPIAMNAELRNGFAIAFFFTLMFNNCYLSCTYTLQTLVWSIFVYVVITRLVCLPVHLCCHESLSLEAMPKCVFSGLSKTKLIFSVIVWLSHFIYMSILRQLRELLAC